MFYVLVLDPIKIQTSQAPNNGFLNPSCVKDINVDGKKMAKNGRTIDNSQGCLFFDALVYTVIRKPIWFE